ncbi:MAG: hypothetical protein ACXV5F_09815 [Halobacteriota archaeon]
MDDPCHQPDPRDSERLFSTDAEKERWTFVAPGFAINRSLGSIFVTPYRAPSRSRQWGPE